MKNKLFISILICIILLSFVSCSNTTSVKSPTNAVPASSTNQTTLDTGDDEVIDNCTLIVNGKDITKGNYARINHTKHYSEIPFTAVIQELGAKVEWENDTKATITFDENKYLLDITEGTLVKKWDSHKLNLITPAPGQNHERVSKVVGNELIVDDSSSLYFFFVIMRATVKVDYDKNIINIEYWEG